MKRTVPVPQQHAHVSAVSIRDDEVEILVPVHIAQRYGNRAVSCGEGLLCLKRAVPVPQQHDHIRAGQIRDGEVEVSVPVQVAQRHRKPQGFCGEGGLIGKACRGIGGDQRIPREVANAAVIDQVQTQRSLAGDPADGHRVHQRTYGGHLRERGLDRSRPRQGKISRIDARHRFAEGYGETHRIRVRRRTGGSRTIDRLHGRSDRIHGVNLTRKVRIPRQWIVREVANAADIGKVQPQRSIPRDPADTHRIHRRTHGRHLR